MENNDFNLLKALDALINTQSVTRMGEHLGITQPAASRVLTRLRLAFADPLLVRTSKGYVLTPRAQALRQPNRDALLMARQVFSTQAFDPQQSTRTFRIASTDYGSVVVLSSVLRSPALLGNGIGIQVEPWQQQTLDALESGTLDLAFYADDPVPGDFHTRDLFTESYGVLMAKTHPLSKWEDRVTKLHVSDLAAYPQLVASYPLGRQTEVDDVMERLGHKGSVRKFVAPYFMVAPWLLKSTDLVMLCPRRAAIVLTEHPDMTWRELQSSACDFTYRMVWHERANKDAGLAWLRKLIINSQASI